MCTVVRHRVLRRPKDIRDHKLAFSCTVCRKVSENKSSRTPPDRSGGNSAIRMAPYMVGRVPSMAFCIVDDYNVVDTLANISGYMNGQRNRGGHTGVGI
jgi:hypothetical protein